MKLSDNTPSVSVWHNGEDWAAATIESATGELPVNFKATENGAYTISVSTENLELDYLHLIDNKTGAEVDLLQTPSYSFEAKTTDYESRFKLVFSTNEADGPSTPSTGSGTKGSGTFAFNSNGSWFISNKGSATLQVVDVNGRILSSETVNGSVSKAINAAPGVYVLRLINGDDVKTQKVVVR